MDVQEFWQENKRWVLGVVAGAIVFWIGSDFVGRSFGADASLRRANTIAQGIREEHFDAAALAAARKESETLAALAERVRATVAFVPDPDFVLEGKGEPETWFPAIAHRVRTMVLRTAQETGVDLDDKHVAWTPPADRDDMEARLLELCVLQHAAARLFEASAEVLARDPEALGLQSIDALKIENKKRAAGARRPRAGEPAAAASLDEYVVTIAFRSDVATLHAWLERLRSATPALGIASGEPFTIQAGEQLGDPVRVKGAVSALVIRQS
ncbi:MAG: hypothetical protein IT457_16355 [Planctomycetes bacterium]|nr:hypothetical protein [Planctomycetota bacterium]